MFVGMHYLRCYNGIIQPINQKYPLNPSWYVSATIKISKNGKLDQRYDFFYSGHEYWLLLHGTYCRKMACVVIWKKKLCSPAKNQIGPASSWGRSIHSPTYGWYYSFSWNKGTLFLTFILVNDNIGVKECTKGISNGATQNGRPNCPCVSFCVDVKMVIFFIRTSVCTWRCLQAPAARCIFFPIFSIFHLKIDANITQTNT
jgi:hypothetical protein